MKGQAKGRLGAYIAQLQARRAAAAGAPQEGGDTGGSGGSRDGAPLETQPAERQAPAEPAAMSGMQHEQEAGTQQLGGSTGTALLSQPPAPAATAVLQQQQLEQQQQQQLEQQQHVTPAQMQQQQDVQDVQDVQQVQLAPAELQQHQAQHLQQLMLAQLQQHHHAQQQQQQQYAAPPAVPAELAEIIDLTADDGGGGGDAARAAAAAPGAAAPPPAAPTQQSWAAALRHALATASAWVTHAVTGAATGVDDAQLTGHVAVLKTVAARNWPDPAEQQAAAGALNKIFQVVRARHAAVTQLQQQQHAAALAQHQQLVLQQQQAWARAVTTGAGAIGAGGLSGYGGVPTGGGSSAAAAAAATAAYQQQQQQQQQVQQPVRQDKELAVRAALEGLETVGEGNEEREPPQVQGGGGRGVWSGVGEADGQWRRQLGAWEAAPGCRQAAAVWETLAGRLQAAPRESGSSSDTFTHPASRHLDLTATSGHDADPAAAPPAGGPGVDVPAGEHWRQPSGGYTGGRPGKQSWVGGRGGEGGAVGTCRPNQPLACAAVPAVRWTPALRSVSLRGLYR